MIQVAPFGLAASLHLLNSALVTPNYLAVVHQRFLIIVPVALRHLAAPLCLLN